MNRIMKRLLANLAAIVLVGSLSGCSSEPPLDLKSYSAFIDVRTPVEFEMGHLNLAQNVDFRGPDFIGEISKYDKGANYFIYCKSGNRAGQAIKVMIEEGFTGTLTNGGGLEAAASSTGLEIVKN